MNSTIKLAAGDQEFEQAFFQLAYDKLQGKLSNLVPFLVGFQLVKKSDNDTKAVGVFGFKSNNGQILFVPAFFINGKIKELEILYSRNNNQFYPLNEDFAELFLKDDVTGLGSVSKQRKEDIQRDITTPNMRNVIWPPRTGRISYAEAKDLTEQHQDEFNKAAEALLSKKTYDKSPELISFVKESDNNVKQAFWSMMSKSAEYTDAVRSFYSDEAIADALKVAPIIKEAKPKKLKVVDFNETAKFKDLTEHSKKEVATKGFTIIDNRLEQETSKLGIFKFTETFTNPTCTGFYPYITEMGTLRYGLIITGTENLITGYSHPKAIVVDLEAERKGQAYECDIRNIFIKDQITVKDFSKAMSLLEEPAEGMPGYEDYVLINENLKATEPFRIIENYKDASGVRRIKVEPTWYNDAKARRVNGEDPVNAASRNGQAVLVLTKKPGDRLEHRNKAVYIPKGYKLLKLNFSTSYYPSYDYSLPKAERDIKQKEIDQERSRIRAGKPGCLSYLAGVLRENNTFPLTLHTNGSDYFLNIGGAKVTYDNPIEAKIAMVQEVGLREADVDYVIKDLVPNIKKAGYIKIATTGEHILELQDEQPESNEFGQPTYYGIPWVDQYDGRDGYTGDPTQQGLGVKPDEATIGQSVQQATQLAQNGQKEVFDTQAIASLSKYTDSNSKVLQYVPSFVSSLDKLGRMLFLAYWDTDTFEEMYGKDELPELIELVKSVFNNLGDLVIFLKRKVPDLSINDNEQSKNDA
jgi:hypothetical protein